MLVVSPGPMSLPFPIKNIIYKHPTRCWWLVPALCPYHFPSKTSYINIPQDVGG